MKGLCFIAAVVISLALPAHAQQPSPDRVARQATPEAVTSPMKIMYRVSGVRDSGGAASVGVATSFHCTNYSKVPENLKIRVLQYTGVVVADKTFTLAKGRTFTASTHATNIFVEDDYLSPGVSLNQGMASVSMTSPKVLCSAMIVDAASFSPIGIALHMVRYNPMTGTME